MKTKTIVTITGIRPDFIRMSKIFKKLDKLDGVRHVLVHTGQHFDRLLSGVFFDELDIRKPDFNLEIGGPGKQHYHQTADLTVRLFDLFLTEKISPDLIVFLGDSNSVASAVELKKAGFRIAHIEAGMRSGDKRMLEEINRTVCDHCSDYHFVYHVNYAYKLINENLNPENIFNVGNTIVEVCAPHIPTTDKTESHIVLDIHRPENFKYKERLENIILFAKLCRREYNIPVKLLKFPRTFQFLDSFGINYTGLDVIDLMSYKQFIKLQYDARFIISDSGTAQEEPALLGTRVIVPRNFTERPESVSAMCSHMLDVENPNRDKFLAALDFIDTERKMDITWLGSGQTSSKIVNKIYDIL